MGEELEVLADSGNGKIEVGVSLDGSFVKFHVDANREIGGIDLNHEPYIIYDSGIDVGDLESFIDTQLEFHRRLLIIAEGYLLENNVQTASILESERAIQRQFNTDGEIPYWKIPGYRLTKFIADIRYRCRFGESSRKSLRESIISEINYRNTNDGIRRVYEFGLNVIDKFIDRSEESDPVRTKLDEWRGVQVKLISCYGRIVDNGDKAILLYLRMLS
tara:strand:- start:220 stop:873 length:654 start_codon:yes stop_codon:yes gene_type:complete